MWQSKGMAVEEKNPGTTAVLGILPGGGSFYTRNYGLGIANLLLWPASVIWDPISGYDGAQALNYSLTKATVSKRMTAEIKELDYQMEGGKLPQEQYLLKKREIEKNFT